MSITQFQAGDPINDRQGVHITPDHAYVRGTVYTLNDAVRDIMERQLPTIAEGIASSNGAGCQFSYERGYPVLVNTPGEKELAVSAASELVGAEHVETDMQPIMGAEDFAFMLKEKPGCYLLVGNGDGEGSCHVHNPNYDFNDDAIPFGVGYWVKLVERYLPTS